MIENRLLLEKRDRILEIAQRHGASNVRVFGSMARGEARPDSDIDLLVDLDLSRTSWGGGGLVIELESLLGRRVDLVTPDDLHWLIRDQVIREAIPL